MLTERGGNRQYFLRHLLSELKRPNCKQSKTRQGFQPLFLRYLELRIQFHRARDGPSSMGPFLVGHPYACRTEHSKLRNREKRDAISKGTCMRDRENSPRGKPHGDAHV